MEKNELNSEPHINNSILKLKTVEGSSIVKYKKVKKNNLFSLYDQVYNKYRNECEIYENSFISSKNDPDLFLSNNIDKTSNLEEYKKADEIHYYNEYCKKIQHIKDPKTKDNFVDMTNNNDNIYPEVKIPNIKYNNNSNNNINIKYLEYKGPLNKSYINQEFLMLHGIFNQLFISKYKNTIPNTKKYFLNKININYFDYYDYYLDEFRKSKEEMLLKEAANYIINIINKKKKDQSKTKFNEIPQNFYFEKFMDKIIHKVEVRKDNNELISVEYIANMIKEEIETNNIKPIIINRKKIEEEFTTENYNSRISFLPKINSKYETKETQEDQKIPFLDYDMVANVKRLKKKGNFSYSDMNYNNTNGNKSNMRYIRDKNGNYILEEDSDEKKNEDDFVNSIRKTNEFDIKKQKRLKERSLNDISEEDMNRNLNISDNELIEKRKKKRNKFLEKMKKEQLILQKNNFDFLDYCSADDNFVNNNSNHNNYIVNNNEMIKSFNLNNRFQKTHINFLGGLNRLDNFFLTTQSSGFDDLRLTQGPPGYNHRKKIKEILLKKQENKVEVKDGILISFI